MRLGIDVSTYFEELEHGAKYFDGEMEVEPLQMFRANGVDIMRIRLWVDPTSDDGEPYLAGNCDLQNFLKLATLAQKKGYGIMLDFHYSDFWVDPGKQTLPKSWQGLDRKQLEQKVYDYTREVLLKVAENNIELQYIQVGNEITNGMLWPFGKILWRGGRRINYKNLAALIKNGCAACRSVYPNAHLVLHLERSYDKEVYDEYFTQMLRYKVDFDSIGMSYYPYWHGTFEQLFDNVDMLKQKFRKEVLIVETGYAFTMEDYVKNEHGASQLVINVAASERLPDDFATKYPLTPEGQAHFVETLLKNAEQHGVAAVCWWEPLWIPGDGICWASEAGQRYINEVGKPTRNEWANQCLFDYQGKALPACKVFAKK